MVDDEGFKSASIVLIGEAPANEEVKQGRPFVGPSGRLLEQWWRKVGLSREMFYITNVVREKVPGNDMANCSPDLLVAGISSLHDRIAGLVDPVLIVPTGNTALSALTGRKGITKYRGSILSYRDLNGRIIKVIPTIHPAACLHYRGGDADEGEEDQGNEDYTRRCIIDWGRIAADSRFRELRVPEITTSVVTPKEAEERVRRLLQADLLAVDIETNQKTQELLCVGFADTGHSAWIFPATSELMPYIKELCESHIPKATQFGTFDAYQLHFNGIELNQIEWDTHAMHHCLDSRGPHTLEYMASVDTRLPYWKDMHKDKERIRAFGSAQEALYHYNGWDCCATYQLACKYYRDLEDRGRLEVYERLYVAMIDPLLRLMETGFRVNENDRASAHKKFRDAEQECYKKLEELAGESLIAKKTFSKIKLERFLYETLGLPKQYVVRKGAKKVSAGENQIRRLVERYPERFREAGTLLLSARRNAKLASFFGDTIADADHRVRASYRFTTETGRLNSSKNPRGTGMNMQNNDRESRYIFVPTKGRILVTRDFSQLENRLVNILTGDPELIKNALSKPWEFDEHWYYAEIIFGKPREELIKGLHRYLGKRSNHGSNYLMGGPRLSDAIFKDTKGQVVVSGKEAQGYIDKVMAAFPAKREWQKRVWDTIVSERVLTTIYERELWFTDEELNKHAWAAGCAFEPQSTGADLLNQQGLIPTDAYIQYNKMPADIVAQVHDSFTIDTDVGVAWELAERTTATMEAPIMFHGVEIGVPAGLVVGVRWGDGEGTYEFKRPPNKEEFEEVVCRLLKRKSLPH